MTPPKMILMAASAADCIAAESIREAILERRSELTIETANPYLSYASVCHSVGEATTEAICMPLTVSCLTLDDVAWQAVVDARGCHPRASIGIAASLGASEELFDAVDRNLAVALRGHREVDALVLWHDGSPAGVDLLMLRRLARAWGRRHRLPVTLARIGDSNAAVAEVVRQHKLRGLRRIAIGTLALHVDNGRLDSLRRLPGAVAVGAPIGPDPIIVDQLLAHYALEAVERTPDDRLGGLDLLTLCSDVEVGGRPGQSHSAEFLTQQLSHGPIAVPLSV